MSREEKEEKSSQQQIEILSAKDFDRLTAEIDELSVEKLLERFEPFEMVRHFQRDCEMDYYWALSNKVVALYNEKKLMLSSTEEAMLLQNLCFAHMKKGEHIKALDFFNRAESLKDKINATKLPLFQARQAQVRGPILCESDQPETPQQSIDTLRAGLEWCAKVSDPLKRYLAEANILRKLAVGYLNQNQQDYQNAQQYFEIGLHSATQGGMSLFSFAMESHLAYVTARLGVKIENEGKSEKDKDKQQKGRSLFDSAVKQFNEVTKKYLTYDKEYRKQHGDSLLLDCEDYSLHLANGALLGMDTILRDMPILNDIAEIRSRVSLFAALPKGNPWDDQEDDAAFLELTH